MPIYWPTQGFKGRTFKLCVLTWWDFNFCVRSSPLQGRNRATRYVFNNHMDMSRSSATYMLEKLDWASLGERRGHIQLGCSTKLTTTSSKRDPPLRFKDKRSSVLYQTQKRHQFCSTPSSPTLFQIWTIFSFRSLQPFHWSPSMPDLVASFTIWNTLR